MWMSVKPEASHKAERDAASFEKFKAVFFEEFLWRNDGAVKVDEAKLIELFDRYFKSENYPTLDELRSAFSFLLRLFVEEEDLYVRFPKRFDQIADVFEENVEKSLKAGLDVSREKSQSTEKEKPPPDEPEELVRECQELQQKIRELQKETLDRWNQRSKLLSSSQRLGKIPEGKFVKGAVQVRVYYPQMSELITEWKPEDELTIITEWRLPEEELTKEEKLAKEAGKKLLGEYLTKLLAIEKAKKRLNWIQAKAKVDGVVLPNVESEESRVKQKKRSKPSEPPPVDWEQFPSHTQIDTGNILQYTDRHIRNLLKEGKLHTTAQRKITTESILAFLANKEDS